MRMKKQAIYIETTIVSYLAARPSRDPFLLGCQRLTRRWWRQERGGYELFSSQFVRDEADKGELLMARRRLVLLKGIPDLEASEKVMELTAAILKKAPIPPKAAEDAAHIATAAVHEMDYLLTWNCSHIANATIMRSVQKVCAVHGLRMPVICTPTQLTRHLP